MQLFIDTLLWKKEKLHYIFYPNFTFEIINIDFCRFGILALRILSFILMQAVGRFDMLVAPN